ncbi:MAG: RNA polymerase sigma factor, partial [Planctomycetota bacterium]
MSPSRGRALVEGCLAEKPGAWDAFLEAYGPFVWSLCLGRGLPRDLAGDAFQATFIIIWQNLGALRDPVALLCWVGRIARREIERIRRTEAAHQRNRLHVAL